MRKLIVSNFQTLDGYYEAADKTFQRRSSSVVTPEVFSFSHRLTAEANAASPPMRVPPATRGQRWPERGQGRALGLGRPWKLATSRPCRLTRPLSCCENGSSYVPSRWMWPHVLPPMTLRIVARATL